jgi:YidC/Oxa1 family membrane protein insertase
MSFNNYGLSLGLSIVCLAAIIKLLFFPMHLFNIKHSYRMKLLAPDINEYTQRIKKLNLSGNHSLAKKENERFNQFKIDNGLTGSSNTVKLFLNLFQGFTFFVFACLMQKYTYKLEDYPQMITGGFLWFSDLTLSDPYFILPLLNVTFLFFNILLNNQMAPQQMMVKSRKIILIIPFLSFPVLTSLQSGMLIYLVTMTGINAMTNFLVKTNYFKNWNNLESAPSNIAIYKVVR